MFKREQLPSVREFYSKYFNPLPQPQTNGWINRLNCPFHDDKHPSFGVHSERGGYFCHACAAKGGDIVDFLMQLEDIDFQEATTALGANSKCS